MNYDCGDIVIIIIISFDTDIISFRPAETREFYESSTYAVNAGDNR